MKRFFTTGLLLACMLILFAGCAADDVQSTPGQEDGQLSVVTTIFPQYDFVRSIAGDNVKLTMLLSPGAESHSYEPTPQDIITIQNCDVFIYVGGESEAWVEKILASMDTENMEIIALLDIVDAVEEEIVEGMQGEHDHDHDHGTSEFDDDDVEARALSDWTGVWQSVYPHLLDGNLDAVMTHKAEIDDEMTAEDYFAYYQAGYATDVEQLVISDDTVTFYRDGQASEARYGYAGYEILTSDSGGRSVRYMFEAEEEIEGAPRFIQFSDHEIGPAASEHFHMYAREVSQQALWEQGESWPTYYPSDWDAADIVEDMIGHTHEDDEDDHDHDDEESELDEHVWGSPKNAIAIVASLTETLSALDPQMADTFAANAESYTAQLQELDRAFQDIVDQGVRNTIVFGDRFPFRYMADAYNLEYYAAFPGCSTETEASAATVAFLIDKVGDEEIPVVFHIEFSNEKMADTICESTGAQKRLFHSCHNISKTDMETGVTYLDLMYQNAEHLREALS